jgi:cellulose synthase/poly-beta-1,6-N-acetylglucosamine synthase-like glycosyltransferase
VCTGNAAYRRQALLDVGLFDETFGYGYDNDMSYRLAAAGHRLVICRDARSIHRWKDRLWAYLRQQYGQGYGRLDLVAKHPGHVHGDIVSRSLMMAHAPLTALALTLLVLTPISRALWSSNLPLYLGLGLLLGLGLERLVAGVRAAQRFSSWAPLGFVVAHFLRDVAWSVAILRWGFRRAIGVPRRPTQSM